MSFFKRPLVRVIAALVPLALAPLSAKAATPAPALSPADQADAQRIETYLNSIHTVAARFLQSTSDGNVVQGNFFLERPGKMRVQYDPPTPLLMVASGIWLNIYDPELKQTTYLPINSTPAYFLVKNRVGLDSDITVTKIEHGKDTLRVSIHEKDHPNEGRLTLVFADKPLQLKKWTVIDRDGKEINVSLLDAQFDGKLDPNLFKFVDPSPNATPR